MRTSSGTKAILKNEVMSLSVPPVQIVVIVTLTAVAGVVAAVGPARLAAKLDILDAIASPLSHPFG